MLSGSTESERIGAALRCIGRTVALIGAILPLLLIGGLKFTAVEVQALDPLIGGTPWLACRGMLGEESSAMSSKEACSTVALLAVAACAINTAEKSGHWVVDEQPAQVAALIERHAAGAQP